MHLKRALGQRLQLVGARAQVLFIGTLLDRFPTAPIAVLGGLALIASTYALFLGGWRGVGFEGGSGVSPEPFALRLPFLGP